MYKNYIIIIFRNLLKYKGYSLINIFGLAIGIASSLLILLWVQDEVNFDKFHTNSANIYHVLRIDADNVISAITSPPIVPALKDDFAEIEKATHLASWSTRNLSFEDNAFIESDYYFVDPDFLEIFSFRLISGNPETVLSDPYSILLTESSAQKYFGGENPIGKVLTMDNRIPVTITGILQDVPKNSSIYFDMLSPYQLFATEIINDYNVENWNYNMLTSFVMLVDGVNQEEVSQKLAGYIQKYNPEDKDYLALQPFIHIHLRSASFNRKVENLGDIKFIWIFISLAFIIILIACLNFMNLATARASKRAREVGVRKVMGANRQQLIGQFLSESLLESFIALLISLLIIEITLPQFNQMVNKELAANIFNNPKIIVSALALCLFTGLFAGAYPALFLSSFQPVAVLKKFSSSSRGSQLFRRILVIIQFGISSALIIGTIIISQQLHFIQNKNIGFQKDQLLQIRLSSDQVDKYESIKNILSQVPGVQNVTASLSLPVNNANTPGTPDWEGKDPNNNFDIRAEMVDFDYIETFGIDLVEGRSFSKEFASDDSIAYMVNEAAVKAMKMDDPIGKSFSFWGREGQIIGVVKDYHFRPLTSEIEPLVLKILPAMFRRVILRIDLSNSSETIKQIEKAWHDLLPGEPFEYRFLDEYFQNLYASDKLMQRIINIFTFLAIFIACLGLLGLAAFSTEQRCKEIGVRKVLGATVFAIFSQFNREFLKWVIIANILSWPVIYIIMNKWLQSFAYRTEIRLWIFLISGILITGIAIITVSYQALKAALANPIKSLRYE